MIPKLDKFQNEDTNEFIESRSKSKIPLTANHHEENGKRVKNTIVDDSDDSELEKLIKGEKLAKLI
jgi:hypothetical protein